MMQLVKLQKPTSLFVFWFSLTKRFYRMRRQGTILIRITSFNLYLMIRKTIQYDQKLERSRLFCPLNLSVSELFFSLVDYRNNYFTSDDPNKIIEFYNGFENPRVRKDGNNRLQDRKLHRGNTWKRNSEILTNTCRASLP